MSKDTVDQCSRCKHSDREHTDYNEVYKGEKFSWDSDSLYCDVCKTRCLRLIKVEFHKLRVEIRKKTLELSDLLIQGEFDEINDDLKKLTKKHKKFYGPGFLNEAM